MKCAIPGCGVDALNKLGVRCRRPDTTAIWSPETGAHLCEKHASAGMRIEIKLTPTDTGEVEVVMVDGGDSPPSRSTRIKKPKA